MACIVLVGGIPGSGKSTIINRVLKEKKKISDDLPCKSVSDKCENDTRPAKHMSTTVRKCYEIVPISYDEVSTVAEQQKLVDIPNGWKDFRKDFIDAVECYVCFLHHLKHELLDISARTKVIFDYIKNKYSSNNFLENQVVLLVEDNFYYSSMRYKWFQVCRKYKLGFCQIFLDCPMDVACKRNNARMTTVPENVIKTMSVKLELPDAKKNPWEKFSFVYNTTEECETLLINEMVELIRTAAENPLEPITDVSEQKREAQMICSQNVVHQADKILRQLTGQVIKQLLTENRNKEDLKVLTSKINQARQNLLKDLSEGTLLLPLSIIEALRSSETESKGVEAEKHLFMLMETKTEEILKA